MGLLSGVAFSAIMKAMKEGYTDAGEMLFMDLDGITEGRSKEEVDELVVQAIREYRKHVYPNIFFLANQLNRSNVFMFEMLDDSYADWDYVNKYDIDGHFMTMMVSNLFYGNPMKASSKIKQAEQLDLSNMIKAFKMLIDNGTFDDYPDAVKEIADRYSYPLP